MRSRGIDQGLTQLRSCPKAIVPTVHAGGRKLARLGKRHHVSRPGKVAPVRREVVRIPTSSVERDDERPLSGSAIMIRSEEEKFRT
jgi:hypothetical protein